MRARARREGLRSRSRGARVCARREGGARKGRRERARAHAVRLLHAPQCAAGLAAPRAPLAARFSAPCAPRCPLLHSTIPPGREGGAGGRREHARARAVRLLRCGALRRWRCLCAPRAARFCARCAPRWPLLYSTRPPRPLERTPGRSAQRAPRQTDSTPHADDYSLPPKQLRRLCAPRAARLSARCAIRWP